MFRTCAVHQRMRWPHVGLNDFETEHAATAHIPCGLQPAWPVSRMGYASPARRAMVFHFESCPSYFALLAYMMERCTVCAAEM